MSPSSAARTIYVLMLGIWAGAGLYHLLVVVPTALASFASKNDALSFVGKAVSDLDTYGMIAGPLVLISLYVGWGGARRRLGPRAVLAALATLVAIVSGYWINPKISALEAQLAGGAAVNLDLNSLYLYGDGLTISMVVTALILLLATPSTQENRPGSRIELGGLRP